MCMYIHCSSHPASLKSISLHVHDCINVHVHDCIDVHVHDCINYVYTSTVDPRISEPHLSECSDPNG